MKLSVEDLERIKATWEHKLLEAVAVASSAKEEIKNIGEDIAKAKLDDRVTVRINLDNTITDFSRINPECVDVVQGVLDGADPSKKVETGPGVVEKKVLQAKLASYDDVQRVEFTADLVVEESFYAFGHSNSRRKQRRAVQIVVPVSEMYALADTGQIPLKHLKLVDNALELDTLGSEQCPYFDGGQQCGGTLKSHGVMSTSMSTFNGVDLNQHQETFECTKCGRKFSRSYKWEMD